MAKGTLVFEFESALDLENQMRAYLRLPLLREVMLKEAEKAPDTARGALGEPAEGMTFTVSSEALPPSYKPEYHRITEPTVVGGMVAPEEPVATPAEPVKEGLKAGAETTPAPEQFQFTRPAWGATSSWALPPGKFMFQFTRPAWGAT